MRLQDVDSMWFWTLQTPPQKTMEPTLKFNLRQNNDNAASPATKVTYTKLSKFHCVPVTILDLQPIAAVQPRRRPQFVCSSPL